MRKATTTTTTTNHSQNTENLSFIYIYTSLSILYLYLSDQVKIRQVILKVYSSVFPRSLGGICYLKIISTATLSIYSEQCNSYFQNYTISSPNSPFLTPTKFRFHTTRDDIIAPTANVPGYSCV